MGVFDALWGDDAHVTAHHQPYNDDDIIRYRFVGDRLSKAHHHSSAAVLPDAQELRGNGRAFWI